MRTAGLALCLWVPAALAQIAADGSLGTQVGRSGSAWSITAGTQLGGNLFHSFSRFNVGTGQSATFSGPSSVQHIVARVTGPEASGIDGTLRSTIPGASLWLINPNGFAFGPGAALDVPGAFHVSSAAHVSLGSSGRFAAVDPASSTLSSAPPGAFGFLGSPGAVSFNGSSLSSPGRTLSVAGGDVTLTNADLRARSGELVISGERIVMTGSNVDADSRAGGVAAGSVTIRGGEIVSVDTFVTSLNRSADPGGGIRIEATRRFALDSGAVQTIAYRGGAGGDITVVAPVVELTRSGQLDSSTSGSGAGGAIRIVASRRLSVSGMEGPYLSGLYSNAGPAGGDGGPITVDAGRIVVSEGVISTVTDGAGNAGSVSLAARDVALVRGGYIDTSTSGAGRGGAVTIRATERFASAGVDRFGYFGGVFALTSGGGDGGAIRIEAGRIVVDEGVVSSRSFGPGNAGPISFAGGDIVLSTGGSVDANSRAGGDGGSISLHASGTLQISGRNRYGGISGVFALAGGSGDAGSIDIAAQAIELSQGVVRSSTLASGRAGTIDVRAGQVSILDGGRFNTGTEGSGEGSTMRLAVAGTLLLDGVDPATGFYSGLLSTSLGSGNGGSIEVMAGDVVVRNGARITAAAFRGGTAGSLLIQAANGIVLQSDGAITTEARTTDGGDITIRARDLLHLRDSAITTSVGGGAGNGGNIAIDPQFVVLENSRIIANAFGGDGGNISIVAGSFLSQRSVVEASSALGISGNIAISAPKTDVTGSLAVLDSSFLDAASLIRESCAARAGRAGSSLSGAGRGGLAHSPMQDAGGSGILPAVKTSSQGGGSWVAVRSGCS